jgi:tRNA A-37 threonylcarbamoyl transferase component Bud32
MDYQDIKIIKRKGDKIICFRFVNNNTYYFGKLVHLDMQSDFIRERDINIYINNNIKNSKYYTKMLNVYENITIPDSLTFLVKDPTVKYNLMIFEFSGNHPLRYYINKLSSKKFNEIIKQIREATDLLNDIGVIHYDLYCESNVMLKKENNNWIIKIIDYGLSYIDLTDKTDSDYTNIIESIEHFNKKHSIE